MDLAELAARTGMPIRRLRYVVDHRVLPGLRDTPAGQGVPRTVTDYEGFAIALAARLLGSGMTRKLVAAGLDAACRPPASTDSPAEAPLCRAYAAADGRLEFGDGRYVRVVAPRSPGVGPAVDTGWLAVVPSPAVAADYRPGVRVAVELGGLARVVRQRPGEAGRADARRVGTQRPSPRVRK